MILMMNESIVIIRVNSCNGYVPERVMNVYEARVIVPLYSEFQLREIYLAWAAKQRRLLSDSRRIEAGKG